MLNRHFSRCYQIKITTLWRSKTHDIKNDDIMVQCAVNQKLIEIGLLCNGRESDYIINRIMGTVSQNTKNRNRVGRKVNTDNSMRGKIK